MKLHDALRNDSEFHEDVTTIFDEERVRLLAQIESLDPTDLPRLATCKAQLDALRQLRIVFFKEELNRGRPRRSD